MKGKNKFDFQNLPVWPRKNSDCYIEFVAKSKSYSQDGSNLVTPFPDADIPDHYEGKQMIDGHSN